MTPRQIKIAAKKEIPDNTYFKEANSKKLLTVIDIARWGFELGAKYALNHQWISVKDELPPEKLFNGNNRVSDWVLIKTLGGGAYIDRYIHSEKCWSTFLCVEYWMPIPEFTKE